MHKEIKFLSGEDVELEVIKSFYEGDTSPILVIVNNAESVWLSIADAKELVKMLNKAIKVEK